MKHDYGRFEYYKIMCGMLCFLKWQKCITRNRNQSYQIKPVVIFIQSMFWHAITSINKLITSDVVTFIDFIFHVVHIPNSNVLIDWDIVLNSVFTSFFYRFEGLFDSFSDLCEEVLQLERNEFRMSFSLHTIRSSNSKSE